MGDHKGSATDFDEEVWYKTLAKALYMEDADQHATVRSWISMIRRKRSA